MSRRSDISLTTALAISTAVHAALLGGGWYGYGRHGTVEVKRERDADPPESLIIAIPPAFGDPAGTGTALNELVGETPMRARQAEQDQAFLRRQEGARARDEVAADTELAPPRPAGGSRSEPAARLPTPADPDSLRVTRPEPRFGLASIPPAPQLPVPDPPGRTRESRSESAARIPEPTAPSDPRPAAQASATGGGPVSTSESDPFRTEQPEIRFERGEMQVRFGRKIRTTVPRLTMASELDVVRLRFPTVVMRVETDTSGNVTSADIHRSSGSAQLDLACRIFMLDWWIEPPTDADGRPLPDVMYWRLSWR